MFNSRQRRRSRWGHARIGILILVALQSVRAILRQLWIQHRYRRSPYEMTPNKINLSSPKNTQKPKNPKHTTYNIKKNLKKKKKKQTKKLEVLLLQSQQMLSCVLFVPSPLVFFFIFFKFEKKNSKYSTRGFVFLRH